MDSMADLSSINVLAELERIGIKFKYHTASEVRCHCPFHEDNSPSCGVSLEKRVFRCYAAGCMKDGDILTLLAGFLKTTRSIVFADLSKRYTLEDTKIVNPALIEQYHAAIWAASPLIKALHDRAVTDELIRKYRLGEHDGRITIPITNENGLFVNVRRYLPGAPGADKMKNTRGFSRIRLYPCEQMVYEKIVVCGGEMKAIVAAAQLNQFGIGAVCATSGEGNWSPALTKQFVDKQTWVCLDIDEAGRTAARELCLQLSNAASWVGDVLLPLDKDRFPKGDINDFVVEGGNLKPLLDSCEEFAALSKIILDDTTPPLDVSLTDAVHAKYAGKRVKVKSLISAMDTAPYAVPREVNVECDRSQDECVACPIFTKKNQLHTLHAESQAVLEIVRSRRTAQRDALIHGFGIPRTCPSVEFTPQSYYNVEDVRISPRLEIASRSTDRMMQPALCIGDGLELNESYNLVGRCYPHPQTQQSTLLISQYETAQDALSSYTPENAEKLKIFQPTEWTISGLQEKLDEIYEDLEANVTRIYCRRDMHLTMDLAYHSALLLRIDNMTRKGWVETIILGDSSQGKSETADGLRNHYGLGEKFDCKNATVAGILGGLQQLGGSRWFVTWGVIPTHDKRLVHLEELKGTSIEVISKLTEMRSSGIAELTKIEKRRTHARTRIIATSNTRPGHRLTSYPFGILALKELIGNLEDIRRFDMAYFVSSEDVPSEEINKLPSDRRNVPVQFTSDLCRDLILWTWTRTESQVIFDEAAMRTAFEFATKLCEDFSDAIPLIDRGSTRLKLARLAASLAARTFSSDDLERIRVRQCHVEYIAGFLRRLYSSKASGYFEYTQSQATVGRLGDTNQIKKQIREVPFPEDFLKLMLQADVFDSQDVQDWTGWDRHETAMLISVLIRKHALTRVNRSYRKTPQFISLLKEMIDKKDYPVRPDHIPTQEF